MPAHAVTPRHPRVKLPRPDDTGHLLRPAGHYRECTCGWRSKRCDTDREAAEIGRQHVRDHTYETLGPVIPPPGTVPPPARHSGPEWEAYCAEVRERENAAPEREDTQATRERGR